MGSRMTAGDWLRYEYALDRVAEAVECGDEPNPDDLETIRAYEDTGFQRGEDS